MPLFTQNFLHPPLHTVFESEINQYHACCSPNVNLFNCALAGVQRRYQLVTKNPH
jgi:hypothetical protein